MRAVCEKYGIECKTASWGKTLRKVFAHIKSAREQPLWQGPDEGDAR